MLRLLLSNCGKNDIFRNLYSFPKIQSNGTRIIQDFSKIKIRKFNKSIQQNSTKKNSSELRTFLVGGCGLSLGLGLKYKYFTVHCEGNRLSGMLSTSLKKDDINFDWKKFWSYLEPYIWELIAAIFAALAVAYFNIRIPNLLGDLVNTLSKFANTFVKDPHSNSFLREVKKPALNLLGIYIIQSGLTFLYIILLSRIGEKMAAKMRQDLFKQIIIQDMAFFDEHRTGELVNRLTADVQDFKSSFKQFVSLGLRNIAQLIGGAVSLCLISPHMAGIALASVPAVVALMSLLGKTLRQLSIQSQAQSEKATAVSEEALSNIRTVRACAGEYTEIELFKNETNLAAELSQQLGYGIAIFQGLTVFFLNGLVLSILFLGGHLMSTDSLSPGQLMAFLVASQGVQRSLAQGSVLLGTMIRGITAGTRVFDYLSIEPNVELLRGFKIPPEKLKGEIQFKNISFSYPTRPDHVVLKDFNLILKPGQTVALVGASGSGKSTVAALLERFYEPTSGAITLDGYDLQSVSPHWLRGSVIGFIEQQPILFATTILENIRYSCPEANENDAIEAAKLSQSHDFITTLPDSYNTNVGERGIQLSGGQRQRIAIARALLKKPIVLIMDEATSALDTASEAVVQRALDKAALDRTTLIIAHRLSTIRNADLIVVLDKGRIVEAGKHDELMAKNGFYYELVKQQEKHEKNKEILPEKNETVTEVKTHIETEFEQKRNTTNG